MVKPRDGILALPPVGTFDSARTLPTSNGIVGHVLPRLEAVTLPWSGRDVLAMHSDEINTRETAHHQPGLPIRPATLIAVMTCARQKRGRDDTAVPAARINSA